MFDFFRKSQHNQPIAAISAALGSNGLPPGMDPATLVVLQQRGSYSSRKVNYFRVYDPVRAGERRVAVRAFSDLDGHPELVLISGHLEMDGSVALTRREPNLEAAATPARSQATRANHADDEQIVFHEATS
jgi:hypothetical protein